MTKDEIQKVTLGTNEALRVTADGEFIWHPEADAMIEYGDFTSSPAMRHILRALRKALVASVQEPHKGLSEHLAQATNGRVYVDPVTGNVGIGTPAAFVQDSTCRETLRAQGKAYPRTCRKCGKGPCIALVNAALDKKAENARELGLDYEPVLKDNSNYRYDPPVAEPVCDKDPQGCWSVRCQLGKKCKNTPPNVATPPAAPDLQAELEATNRQVEILSDALAESRREVAALKAVQEPVAWMHVMDNTEGLKANGKGIVSITQKRKHPFGKPGVDFSKSYPVTSTPLYTTPPAAKRQLVGLTEDEIDEIFNNWPTYNLDHFEFGKVVEAKVFEKNGAIAVVIPDALNPKDENPAYAAGWNDCRAEMLKGMKP
jgi:hypothetical protein